MLEEARYQSGDTGCLYSCNNQIHFFGKKDLTEINCSGTSAEKSQDVKRSRGLFILLMIGQLAI